MFEMRVNPGDLAGAEARFEAAYQEAVGQMKSLLDEKASAEREGHTYENRTGDLQASTQASDVVSTGDSDTVDLRADTPYAVYVNARGLMQIDELAAEAEGELEYLFDGLALVI